MSERAKFPNVMDAQTAKRVSEDIGKAAQEAARTLHQMTENLRLHWVMGQALFGDTRAFDRAVSILSDEERETLGRATVRLSHALKREGTP